MATIQSNSLKSTIITLLGEQSRSLADLRATTQVSLPTLRQALQELSDSGWVCPVGRSSSTGGRRATLFGLNGQTHLIIGVHLEIPTLNMVLSGLNGHVIDRIHLADQEELLPDEAISTIVDYVRHVQTNYPHRKLLGLGLAMPGFIDLASGKILFSVRAPQWQNFPLKARLESELGLPVIIENDVDCMTLAELAQANIPDATDMLYLGFSEGVKVSILLGGHLIKGPFGNAGMIGRTVASRNELQEIASVSTVCREFDQRVSVLTAPNGPLRAITTLTDRNAKFKAILDAAEAEPLCNDLITGVIDTLAEEISKLIQILQPTLLIIGGALTHLPPNLRVYMEKGIRNRLPPLINNYLVVRYAMMVGARMAAIGAVHHFLQRYDVEKS
jgi:predicted NBD/HSP70 family sugar kinase